MSLALRESIQQLQQLETELTQRADNDLYDSFTQIFYELYHELYECCQGQPEAQSKNALDDYLKQSSVNLESRVEFLDGYLSERIEKRICSIWYGDEWFSLCRWRSTIEALRELYGPFLKVAELIPEDPDLDAMIRSKGESEALQHPIHTPKYFPESHWWWGLK